MIRFMKWLGMQGGWSNILVVRADAGLLVRAEVYGPIYLGGASYSVSGSPTGSSGYGSRYVSAAYRLLKANSRAHSAPF